MNILVLQLKRIGDLVLTTPALVALRRAFPDAQITLLVESGSAGLLAAMPSADHAVAYKRGSLNRPVWQLVALGKWDACLDFTGSDRSALVSLLSRAGTRAAFESVRRKRGLRRYCYNRFVASSVREQHTIDHYMRLLSSLEVAAEETPPITLEIPQRSAAAARAAIDRLGVRERFAMIHPGTARREKYWVPERWAEVIGYCEERLRLPCVLTGGTDRFEQEYLDAIRTARGGPVRDLSGQLDLCALAAVAREAALVLSMDSAPMHLAAASATPQVALFGPTNPFHWQPRHDRAIVVAPLPGVPPFSPRGYQPGATTEISTQQVIDGIHALPGFRRPDASET